MWQRFTERARRVVFFAQEEAARLGENYVGTEHLLLGLVRENDSVAARILDRLGVPLGRIRAETRLSGRGAHPAWCISHQELLRYQREGSLPLLSAAVGK